MLCYIIEAWLSVSNWDNISELDKLPGFLGIEKSFAQFSREWKQWYMSPDPENQNLIGELKFQKYRTKHYIIFY